MRRFRAWAFAALATITAIAACSAGTTQGSSSSLAGSGGSGAAANGTGGSILAGSGTGAGSGAGGVDIDAACGIVTQQAQGNPVDLYIAMDRSSSMAGDKWDGAKAGLQAFLADGASAGLDVALNFFPLDGSPTCDQHLYEPPVVDFGVLPHHAAALNQGMATAMPDLFSTPIYPALGGAILDAKQQADGHPGDVAAVLLITDGAPDGPSTMCGAVNPDDPTVIAMLAQAGVGYGVKTFVVGLPGVDQGIADQIAAAGGTTSAILVAAGDVTNNFKAALAKVRGATLPCAFAIPDRVTKGQVDKDHVNVLLTPGGGPQATLPQNADCSGDGLGWKYDDPSDPTKIVLCPKSCSKLQSDYSARVDILLGCVTVIK